LVESHFEIIGTALDLIAKDTMSLFDKLQLGPRLILPNERIDSGTPRSKGASQLQISLSKLKTGGSLVHVQDLIVVWQIALFLNKNP
jgi:hypothetical protein